MSRRFSTPVNASIIVGMLIIGLAWVYLLATSVQDAFTDMVDVTGLLFAIFYILTALATIAYYRRRVFTGPGTPCSWASCRWPRPASLAGSRCTRCQVAPGPSGGH